MIDKPKCVRCYKDMNIFDYANDAEDYKDELLAEGIALTAEAGWILCDDCAEELVS
jgi:hypothetical protein